MSPSDFYIKNIFDKFGYFATWFPNSQIKIGDIGIMDGYYFKRFSSLDEMNLHYAIRNSDNPLDFSYSRQANLSFTSNASANALNAIASGEVKIEFTNAGSFVFETNNCHLSEIESKLSLGEEIKKLFKKASWEIEWVVIDTILAAGSSTILISNSRDSTLELSTAANLPQVNLTDTKLNFKIKSQTGELTKFIAAQGLSPLFTTSKLKRSFLSGLTRRKDDIRFGGSNAERSIPDNVEQDIWEKIAI